MTLYDIMTPNLVSLETWETTCPRHPSLIVSQGIENIDESSKNRVLPNTPLEHTRK